MGAASCFPFALATKQVRSVDPTRSGSLAALFLAPIGGSFLILGVGIVVCGLVARDVLIAYSCAEIVAFLAAVLAFGFVRKRR